MWSYVLLLLQYAQIKGLPGVENDILRAECGQRNKQRLNGKRDSLKFQGTDWGGKQWNETRTS